MRDFLRLAALTLLLAGCPTGNRAPSTPELNGPTSGRPGDTLAFTVAAIDPEGGDVSYKIVWGDTSSIEWSPFYASYEFVLRRHVYTDSGVYWITVMARDTGLRESKWSDSFRVTIRHLPPDEPDRPEGPAYCSTGVSYEYRFRASHPQNDSLWYQVDWAGEVEDWRGPVASDSWLRLDHAFDTAGSYAIAARARDGRGLISGWSDTLLVTVIRIPAGPPQNCTLAALTDTTVRIWWSPPAEGQPDFYRVSFNSVGGGGSVVIAETTALAIDHDPAGLTGTYSVAAVFGATAYTDTAPLTTVPIRTGSVSIRELSGTDNSGCGWNRALGIAVNFPMFDTVFCDSVDFYCTDFQPGSSGPVYYVASPDTAVFDSGGSVPTGPWRNTPLALLADEQGPVPPSGDSSYRKAVALETEPTSIGVLTADGYYCIVQVVQIRIPQHVIHAQAWFQAVRGLRLVGH